MTYLKKAKEELEIFLAREWRQEEADYFENSPVFREIDKYSKEIVEGNTTNIRKYAKLLNSLGDGPKIAMNNYMLKKFKKSALEFIVAYGNNKQVMEEFVAHGAVGLNCAKTADGVNPIEFPSNPYLN